MRSLKERVEEVERAAGMGQCPARRLVVIDNDEEAAAWEAECAELDAKWPDRPVSLVINLSGKGRNNAKA